jgi:hypothetical protein
VVLSWIQRGPKSAPWDHLRLTAGDSVQLGWSAGKGGYIAVLALEDGRVASVLYPAKSEDAVTVPPGESRLGDSLIATPSLAGARVYVLFGSAPFSVAETVEALARGAAFTKTATLAGPEGPIYFAGEVHELAFPAELSEPPPPAASAPVDAGPEELH